MNGRGERVPTPRNSEMETRCSDLRALEQKGYRIGRKIGKGSYATVVTAQYTDASDRKIKLACKIVNKNKAPRDFLDKFFPRELDIIAKIEHPYIIQTHSILQRGPSIFIFMRYAENGDLLDYVKQHGPTAEPQARIWFTQMTHGLKYLHSLNLAHRDLKCENVLLSKHMNIKLADFGFARYCTDSSGSRILSQTYCGSGSYAAPEVVSGVPYNPKIADIWSLGVILFIMINSSMPFDDTNLTKLLSDQRKKRYHFGSKVVDQIPYALRMMVDSLLEPDITQRWSLNHILNSNWLLQSGGDVGHDHCITIPTTAEPMGKVSVATTATQQPVPLAKVRCGGGGGEL